MKKLYRLTENISLAVLANSVYSLFHQTSSLEIYIALGSIYVMYIAILYQGD